MRDFPGSPSASSARTAGRLAVPIVVGGEGAHPMSLLQQPADPDGRLEALRPDFLIISPAKTGSSWLAANVNRHPQLFIAEGKEVKYFSSFLRWFDLDWYLDHFVPARGRSKGEASPSYALLPVERIRLIRSLMPGVRLVYLMREPVARAWSHARHNHLYGEANFLSLPSGPATEGQWRENFTHDWPLNSGDYLGQLRRWLSVFPPEQMYVGFYESIAREPAALLRRVFAFLGADPLIDLSSFPLTERILAGSGEPLTAPRARFLHRVWHHRTLELASFLQAHFGLRPPPEWQAILSPAPDHERGEDGPVPGDVEAFRREFDDPYLASVAAQEASFPGARLLVEWDYRGYRIEFNRGEFVALAGPLGPVFPSLGPGERARLGGQGLCFVAPTLAEVKELVARYLSDQERT
jgi:hypothetical protein